MTKGQWRLVSKKGKNFEIFFVSMVADGLAPAKKTKARPLQLVTSAWIQTGGNRYFKKSELNKHINKVSVLLKNRPEALLAEYKHYQKILQDMKNYAGRLPQNNFAKLDWPTFLKNYSAYIGQAIQYGYNYYFLNQPIADLILTALERNRAKNKFADFEILSQAKELSVIQREKKALLNLVKKIKAGKIKPASKEYNAEIKKHLKKYAFMGMYYFRGKPWLASDVAKRLNDWLKDDWQTELKKVNHFAQADQRTVALIKKYKFTPYEKKIIKLMKEMAYATNRYDEVHNWFTYKSLPLLKYLAKKIGLTYDEFIEINFQELLDLLKKNKRAGAKFKKILRDRDKKSALLGFRGTVRILTGRAADDFYKKEIGEEKIKKSNLLKGQCASQGQAKGKVVIFRSEQDIPKITKGCIMVAAATVPSFVPAMEKAEGIITEMGGLLSHAAIVSRELGVPCVVGVSGAMKILKNGDRVEVNADKGIIKKL
jgi:phosphohistidine swiveling domain-containing protein